MKNIHVLPTDKPSRLYLSDYGKELNLSGYPLRNYTTGQHIYITSDEEIKEGDWFLWKDTEEPYLFKCIGLTDEDSLQVKNTLTGELGTYHRNPKDSDYGDWYRCYSKKIILTTDQDLIKKGIQSIDDEFLEWFVKNPSCEEVEIVLENYKEDEWVDDDFGGEIYTFEYEKYKIIIPKEEPKLSNICIKCGVDLYATEGRFECQKHPKECKGIYLSKETLLIHAAEQKQHLIDMMKSDEELGLYEEPKTKCYCGHTTYCDCGPEQHVDFINSNIDEFDKALKLSKQECMITKIMEMDAKMAYDSLPKKETTLEEAAERLYPIFDRFKYDEDWVEDVTKRRDDFIKGAKWQQERMYSEEDMISFAKWLIEINFNYTSNVLNVFQIWKEQFKKK
jgi:hypothetical protein